MEKNDIETAYSTGFATGVAFGIEMIMCSLKEVLGNEKISEDIRFFLRGFIDSYQKDAPQIAEKVFKIIKEGQEGRNEICH